MKIYKIFIYQAKDLPIFNDANSLRFRFEIFPRKKVFSLVDVDGSSLIVLNFFFLIFSLVYFFDIMYSNLLFLNRKCNNIVVVFTVLSIVKMKNSILRKRNWQICTVSNFHWSNSSIFSSLLKIHDSKAKMFFFAFLLCNICFLLEWLLSSNCLMIYVLNVL